MIPLVRLAALRAALSLARLQGDDAKIPDLVRQIDALERAPHPAPQERNPR